MRCIPGSKKHGAGSDTVHKLMKAPWKNTIRRYVLPDIKLYQMLE